MRTRIGLTAAVLAAFVVPALLPAVAASVTKSPSTGRATLLAVATGGGCGQAISPGSTTYSIKIGGRRRTVIVHIPTAYSGANKVPLVLNLHGSGSTAAQQEAFTGMDAESDTAGFVLAYPQALIPSGIGFDWNIPGAPLPPEAKATGHQADDVTFLTQLVSVLEGRYCIDPSRVYATGFSGGARMTSQLACDDSNIFAAIAPVSGIRRPTPCPTVRAVPVISFHGTSDPVDPYNGHGRVYWTYSVPQAARDWATQDDCSTHPLISRPDAGVTLTRYAACPGRTVVELFTIAGEGHEWPGGPRLRARITRVLGPQSTLDADQLIWAFFSSRKL